MTFKIGDRVRLTGSSWKYLLDSGIIEESVVTITGISEDGEPIFKNSGGAQYYIYTTRGADYSGELANDEWITAFTEVEETVKVKKVADKPDLSLGDVLVVKKVSGDEVTYFAASWDYGKSPYLYNSSVEYVKWETVIESAESYRFLFKDGKVV